MNDSIIGLRHSRGPDRKNLPATPCALTWPLEGRLRHRDLLPMPGSHDAPGQFLASRAIDCARDWQAHSANEAAGAGCDAKCNGRPRPPVQPEAPELFDEPDASIVGVLRRSVIGDRLLLVHRPSLACIHAMRDQIGSDGLRLAGGQHAVGLRIADVVGMAPEP